MPPGRLDGLNPLPNLLIFLLFDWDIIYRYKGRFVVLVGTCFVAEYFSTEQIVRIVSLSVVVVVMVVVVVTCTGARW